MTEEILKSLLCHYSIIYNKLPVITVPFHFRLIVPHLKMTSRKKSHQSDVGFYNKSPLKCQKFRFCSPCCAITVLFKNKLTVITVPFHFRPIVLDLKMTSKKKSCQFDVGFQNKSPLKCQILKLLLNLYFFYIYFFYKLPVITAPFHFRLIVFDLRMPSKRNHINLMWDFTIKAF